MKKTILLTAILGLGLSSLSAQTVPLFINYQGKVTASDGSGLGGATGVNRKVIFRIFDAPTAGNKIWGEQQTVTLVNGEFSVLLGQGINLEFDPAPVTPRPALDTVFTTGSPARYLEIVVDNGDNTLTAADAPITPRQQITTAAYSFRARSADTIANGNDLQLNNSSNYGLGYYGPTRPFNGVNVDGPVLYGNAGGALGSNVNGTQNTALRWDSSGNVAVGINSLGAKFTVYGTAAMSATSGAADLAVGDVAGRHLSFQGGNGTSALQMIAAYNGNTQTDLFLNYWGGASAVYITGANAAAKVSIGTSSLSEKFNVGGNSNFQGQIKVDNSQTAAPANGVSSGLGTRIVLWPGSTTDTAFALGIDNSTLWSGVPSNSVHKWYTGTTERMSLDANTLRIAGLVRMGSETGTSQAPNLPGLVIRRINSSSSAAGQVVARNNEMTLERDGTPGGFIIRFAAGGGSGVVTGQGITHNGSLVNVYNRYYSGSTGTVQIFTTSQILGHIRLTFGNPYNNSHLTEVVLTRFVDTVGNDTPNWSGTVTSTFNQ